MNSLKQSQTIDEFNKNVQKLKELYKEHTKNKVTLYANGMPLHSLNYNREDDEKFFDFSLTKSGLVSNSKAFNAMNDAKKQIIQSKLNNTQPIKDVFNAAAGLLKKDANGNNIVDTSKILSLNTKDSDAYIRNMKRQTETQTRNLQRLQTLSAFKQVIGDQGIAQPESIIKYFESNPNKPNILKNLGYEDNADGRQKLRNNINQALTYMRQEGLSEDAIVAAIIDSMDNADGNIKNNIFDNVNEWKLTDIAKDFQEALPDLYALQFFNQNLNITESLVNNIKDYQNASASDRPRDKERALNALLKGLNDLNRYSSVQ